MTELLDRLHTLAQEGLAPRIAYSTSPQENTFRALLRMQELFREIQEQIDLHRPPPAQP